MRRLASTKRRSAAQTDRSNEYKSESHRAMFVNWWSFGVPVSALTTRFIAILSEGGKKIFRRRRRREADGADIAKIAGKCYLPAATAALRDWPARPKN
jgi:hypothetical protein